MIQGLHHIALIVSSEDSLRFYERFCFAETERVDRGYDTIVFMDGPCPLEIFIDPNHPPRVDRPEALGLRHLCLKVDDVEKTLAEIGLEAEPIRLHNGRKFTFIKDPDGLPVELHE